MGFAIPMVLLARFVTFRVGLSSISKANPYSVKILTWGGLRRLAIAMAMSVPAGHMVLPEKHIDVREIIIVMTYAVVVFLNFDQGSTITKMIEKSKRAE